MNLYFRLLSYVRPYLIRITIAIICTMMQLDVICTCRGLLKTLLIRYL